MTIYFSNAEAIDINAITILGVNVKTGSNPIGHFGTGLKFAIATLLRTGHEIVLWREGLNYQFKAQEEVIRGEGFQRVVMIDPEGSIEKLGFTTMLGRNWEVWQAYRELYCNAQDENGFISDKASTPEEAAQLGTVFAISGEGIEQAHMKRRETFLDAKTLAADDYVSIHVGGGNKVYYRGVRAHELPQPGLMTYNLIVKSELTEDRTLKYSYVIQHWAQMALAQCMDEDLIEKVVMAEKGTFENTWNFELCGVPSPAFMKVMSRLRNNLHCNHGARELWRRNTDEKQKYEDLTLDEMEQRSIEEAFVLLQRLGVEIIRSDFIVLPSLGPNIFGAVKEGKMFLARATLDLGYRFIASTLYEEYLHLNHSLPDCSRELQGHLFEKLMTMVDRVVRMEASPIHKMIMEEAAEEAKKLRFKGAYTIPEQLINNAPSWVK